MTAGLLGIEPRLAGLEAADFPLVDRPVVQEGIEPIQILRVKEKCAQRLDRSLSRT